MIARRFPKDFRHLFNLRFELFGQFWRLLPRQNRPHRGQRCLQAVREIVERLPVALGAGTLSADEDVHVAGYAAKLCRKAFGKRLPITLFDLADFLLDSDAAKISKTDQTARTAD